MPIGLAGADDPFAYAQAKGIKTLRLAIYQPKVAGMTEWTCTLDDLQAGPCEFDDDTFDEMLALHVVEHIRNPLAAMQELYRIAKPGCVGSCLGW